MLNILKIFQVFLEDRYRNEKSLAGGNIEIYEVMLKELRKLNNSIIKIKDFYIFMANYTDEVLNEIARIAHAQGLEAGDFLRKALESGELTPGERVNLLIPIGKIKLENFSLLTRATLALGTPTAGVVGNSVIVGLGVYTGGNSALQYIITTNKRAKTLYALSAVFSTSAVVSGGVSVAARTCQISGTAALSEAFGFAFMQLGNKAHVTALQLEGKPVPPRLKRFINPNLRPLTFNTDGLGFIMPRRISSTAIGYIPFEKIGQLVGLGLAVYGYSKIIIVSYRYGQQLLSKFRRQRKSKLIKIQAIFLLVKMERIIYKTHPKRQRHILFGTGTA